MSPLSASNPSTTHGTSRPAASPSTSPAHAALSSHARTGMPPYAYERAELLQLACAFDGIVGAVQDHQPVLADELLEATRAASLLWDCAGPEWHAADLRQARSDLERHADAAQEGDPHATALVERAAHRIAQDLRWRAHAVPDGHGPVAFEVRRLIHHLDARFARFAYQAVPAPM